MTKTVALCLGGALTVWDDYAAAQRLLSGRLHNVLVVTCNLGGLHYAGHLDAWVSLHSEWMSDWIEERRRLGYPDAALVGIHREWDIPGAKVLDMRWPGSSGLYMAQFAIEVLGAERAILCGVPMDGTGSHIHHGGAWEKPERYHEGFVLAKCHGAPIRSMSGWTRDLMGAPDAEWLT
jgi:hypothetical protein